MRVLLTGGTGFIGRHVVRALLAEGHEVTVVTRAPANVPAGVHALQADLGDAAAIGAAVERSAPEVVLHLAARLKSDEARAEYVRVNVQGTLTLLEACASARPAIVYASTMSVYDFARPSYVPVDDRHPIRPTHVYGETKQVGETLCHAYAEAHDVGCVIVRLPGVYGGGRNGGLIYNLLQSAASGKSMTVGALETRRDFLYVKDAARAIVAAAHVARGGARATCNLSGGGGPLAELIAAVSSAVGQAPPYTVKGTADADFYFDPAVARSVLGFEPMSPQAAIADYWTSLRQNDGAEPCSER